MYAGRENWRFAIAHVRFNLLCIFGILFYRNVQNTPPGKVYQRPARDGGMEVTSRKSFWVLDPDQHSAVWSARLDHMALAAG